MCLISSYMLIGPERDGLLLFQAKSREVVPAQPAVWCCTDRLRRHRLSGGIAFRQQYTQMTALVLIRLAPLGATACRLWVAVVYPVREVSGDGHRCSPAIEPKNELV